MFVRLLRYKFVHGNERDGLKLGEALVKAAQGETKPLLAQVLRSVDAPEEFIVLVAWPHRAAAGQQAADLIASVGQWAMGQISERTDKTFETVE